MNSILIKPKEFHFLQEQLQVWKNLLIVGVKEEEAILSLYDVRKSNLFKGAILFSLGALLLGLGIFSAVAANWDFLHKGTKFSLIIATYVAVLTGSYFSSKSSLPPATDALIEPDEELMQTTCTRWWGIGCKNNSKLSSALLFLSSLVYGAGIILVSQIFNIAGDPMSAIELWLLGVIPTVILFSDKLQMILVQILVAVYFLTKESLEKIIFNDRHYGEIDVAEQSKTLLIILTVWILWLYCINPNKNSNVKYISKDDKNILTKTDKLIFNANILSKRGIKPLVSTMGM